MWGMAFFGAVYWFTEGRCLDEEFDAPDIGADRELCRAIAAGRVGLHPDAWGNHDLLTTLPPHYRRHEPPEPAPAYDPTPAQQAADEAWEAEHRRRPVQESPIKRPPWVLPPPPEIFTGEIELSCDECRRRFWLTLGYKSGERSTKAMHLRAIGAEKGWTHILGRDRCPTCSGIPAPDDVGNGAGQAERDKQHADGC